jgi:ribosomal protein S18 acetylase RimI-like enzyme
MEGLIAEAQRRKMRKVCLNVYESNNRAVRLYDKFNFRTDGYFAQQEWTEDGKPLDVYSMSLFL